MLGHANIDTTQKHYATVLLDRIDRETRHLRQPDITAVAEQQTTNTGTQEEPANFDKMVQMLADAVAHKIKVA